MLAAMNSLATLARAAAPAAPAFNRDFYTTAATVIPVLFLALTIEEPVYEKLLRAALKAETSPTSLPGKIIGGMGASVLLLFAYAILVSAALGETAAIIALYQQRENGEQQIVLTTTLILLAAVCAAPVLALARGYIRYWRRLPWDMFLQAAGLTVQPAASAPGLAPDPNDPAFTVGQQGSYKPVLTGTPALTVSVSSGTLPAGLQLDSSTGVISGTPAAGTAGTYNITLVAHNGISPDATRPVTLTVNAES
jgi:Putative Ig domain